MSGPLEHVKRALIAVDSLTLYRTIFDDPLLSLFRQTLRVFRQGEEAAGQLYSRLLGELIESGGHGTVRGGDLWKNHLCREIVSTDNGFTRACERNELKALGDLLTKAAANDLKLLQMIARFDLLSLPEALAGDNPEAAMPSGLADATGAEKAPGGYPEDYFRERNQLVEELKRCRDWSTMLPDLHAFYRAMGSGMFGRYRAFVWSEHGGVEELRGIERPDPIRLEDLVGYEEQKKEITRNTGQFVHGYSANNMLLYGDRGTGKSSMIKSLLHLFGAEGLRMIEIKKSDLLSLRRVTDIVVGRAQKFIVFIDDLSFEEEESQFKELKALLEGSIAAPPENVLIYATSNRRNLVREYFDDRLPDEVGRQDTCQEKLSLADRFGIKLVFAAPDQRQYLETVLKIAQNRGISLEKLALEDMALKWAMWHNSRSGRTARQFVDDLLGRLALQRDTRH